jgi:hypothetical protein
MRAKIASTLGPVFGNPARRKVLVLASLLSNFQTSTDPSFIMTATGIDPYKVFIPVKEI